MGTRKRFLSMILSLMMLLFMLPAGGWAEELPAENTSAGMTEETVPDDEGADRKISEELEAEQPDAETAAAEAAAEEAVVPEEETEAESASEDLTVEEETAELTADDAGPIDKPFDGKFSSFEELKQICSMKLEEDVTAEYTGSEALVLKETITLPAPVRPGCW